MTLFTYTPAQADALIAQGACHACPWVHYARRADSTLCEFEIDQQGTHQGMQTQALCEAHWMIVLIAKCELQARSARAHDWRDHRLRLINQCGIPY